MPTICKNIKQFCEYLDDVIKHMNGEMSQLEWDNKYPEPDYTDKELYPHGKLIDCKQDTYCNVYIYEDGYEEYELIGD